MPLYSPFLSFCDFDHVPVPVFTFTFHQGVDGDERMMESVSLEAIYSVQKMAEVLVAGPDSEREFILFEVQQLLDHCLDDTMKILIPVLCENVPTWNIDLQIKSAQRLFDVVCLDLEPATANMITCASFGVIHASKGKAAPEYEELYNLWGGILVDCLPNMRWTNQEVKDVVALVDLHAKEPLYTSRKVAARVIGALAQCLDKVKVEKVILPRAIQLFEDTDIEVRGMVVESLASVGAALPIRVTEVEVWPRIERLLEPPEEARLRATAMRTMAHILESHREKSGPSKLFRDLLPPVFARLSVFARKFSAEDQRMVDDDTYLLLEVASEVFGQFAFSLASLARKSFRKEAYKAYAGMATCNGPLIRRNCAFNLPGVAKALGERYALELSGLCEYLAKDTDEEVRWILAAGIHETAALLAPRGNFERLFTAVCSLLQDENPMVRMNALAHFHDLLSAFARDGTDPASVRRLAPVFTDLNMLSEGEWRIQKSLAEQLGKCAEIIPPDALLDSVLPLLNRLIEQGTPLVRKAAMDATAKSIRNIPSLKDRNTAIDRYWKAAAKGPFWMRLALMDGGEAAMKVFSYKRFAELFAGQMLQMATDPVANVRIRVASVLASMAPMCMGTPEYKEALKVLQKDNDVDVIELLQDHDDREVKCLKAAKDNAVEDQNKYREEQEFYGFLPRTQKRARNRLNSARGNRIMLHVRRPSLEQSSGQLSVSKAVISAAKASSAAASAMKPAQHPKLPETDSAIYLGPTMENVDSTYRNAQPGILAGDDGSGGVGGDAILNSLAHSRMADEGASESHRGRRRDAADSKASQSTHRGSTSSQRVLNDNVSVLQKTQSKSGRYEARSKSWNGMLAQIPRQLSMETRSKKGAATTKTDEQVLSGWGKQGKEGPRKALSGLRRRRKKRAESNNRAEPRVTGHAPDANPSTMSAEEFGIASPGVAGQVQSMENNLGGANSHADVSAAVGRTDFASMGSLPTSNFARDISRPNGVAGQELGRQSSSQLGEQSQHTNLSGGMRNVETDTSGAGGSVPVVFVSDTGLPSFKGNAPWTRSKTDNEDLEAISDAARRKVLSGGSLQANGSSQPQPRSVISSFHNSASKVFGSKSTATSAMPTSLASNNATNEAVTTEATSSHGGGFFRRFRKRR